MARADGTGSPQQILIALLGNRDVQPGLPRGTASVVDKKKVRGSIGTSLHGRLKNTLGFSGGQGYKQNRQVSPLGSQQLAGRSLTATLHPGHPTHILPQSLEISMSQSKTSEPKATGCFPAARSP